MTRGCNVMIRIESPSNAGELAKLAEKIIELARSRGASPKAEGRLRLVLEELLTNIRLYAYPAAPPSADDIAVEIMPVEASPAGILRLRILDRGPGFDPLKDAPAPDLAAGVDERPIGGLGVFLVRKMTCALEYERVENEYNQITLDFPLAPEDDACAANTDGEPA